MKNSQITKSQMRALGFEEKPTDWSGLSIWYRPDIFVEPLIYRNPSGKNGVSFSVGGRNGGNNHRDNGNWYKEQKFNTIEDIKKYWKNELNVILP